MKFITSYERFKDSLNEKIMNSSSFGNTASMPKLDRAADLIASFINKKTRKAYKKVASFTVNYNGAPAIMLVSDKDDSVIYVVGKGSHRGPGIVSALVYNGKDTFSVESKNFPIVALLNEFVKLINEPSYKKEVETIQESLDEGRRVALTPVQQKSVLQLLQQGKSAMSIARDLNLSYGQILKLRANPPMDVSMDDSVVNKNEETLADKVKFLNETLEDIYDVTRAIAAGAPNMNSLMISGRAGTGKSFNVEKALTDEGLVKGDDFIIVSGAVSTIMMFKKMFQYRTKVLVFDDCDAVFRDENGRNILKAALDSKKIRNISYLKKSSLVFDPKDFEMNPEGELSAIEGGLVPNQFEFSGRVIFISNLPKDKADPDGAIRSRSILMDVNPDDATLMERIRILLPHLEPRDMSMDDKEEIFEFMKRSKDVSMRTFVKAAGFKNAGLKNWERMTKRYL